MDAMLLILKLVFWILGKRFINALLIIFCQISFLVLITCNMYLYSVQQLSDFNVREKHLDYLLFVTNQTSTLSPGPDSRELKLESCNTHFNQATILKWLIYSHTLRNTGLTIPSHFTIWICWPPVGPLICAYTPPPFDQLIFLFYHIFPIILWPWIYCSSICMLLSLLNSSVQYTYITQCLTLDERTVC